MKRPLLITDCDEVLLRFLPHFAEWLDEKTDLTFSLDAPGFADALRHKDGRMVKEERAWALLDLFFDGEMYRQHLVPGAIEALRAIEPHADIVILTNIGDQYQANRVAQLAAFDIRHRVLCNQGGKGRPVRELIEAMRPRSGACTWSPSPTWRSSGRKRRTPMPGSTIGTRRCPGFWSA